MAESAPIQVAFNGGKLDALMAGRVDLAIYSTACRSIENFIPTVQGPALKRSGARFVKNAFSTTQASRLIPFEFSRDQAYVLEFGDNKIRINRDSGAVLETAVAISAATPPTIANPCVITTNAAHGYATGDEIFITGSRLEFLNDQFFTITVLSATTFSLSYYGAAVSSVGESLVAAGTNTVARTYQIADGASGNAIPWNHDELDGIKFAQDGDTMYLVHPSYPPHKLVRTSDTSWSCTQVAFAWPPFRDENISTTTVYASAATGSGVTLTASAAIFTSNMIGGYVKLGEVIESVRPAWIATSNMSAYFSGGGVSVGDWVRSADKVYELAAKNGGSVTGELAPVHDYGTEYDTQRTTNNYQWSFVNRGWGYALITAVGGGGTTATVTVVVTLPKSVLTSGTATRKWAIGAFSAEYGYPSAVAVFEQRLWFGGTTRDPQTFWGSRTNRYEDFERIASDASAGLQWTIASKKKVQIQWMTGEDALIIGTSGGEFTAASNSTEESITPDNIKVKKRSGFGSAANVAPVFVDSALMMVHRNGRRMHELVYDFDTDRYAGADMTARCSSIFGDGARGIEYQASPYRQIFVHTTDGKLVSMTYVRDEEVIAWTEYIFDSPIGTSVVESVAVIPHPDGDQDQVWVVVKYTGGGDTYRWIQILEKPFLEGDAVADAFFVDGGVTYSGAATTTINGLLHVRGLFVNYLNAGVVGTGVVSSNGKLTVVSTTKIHIGFAVAAELETMDFEAGQPPFSSAQGSRGRVVGAVWNVHNTGYGLYYGQRLSGTLDLWSPPAELVSSSLTTGKSAYYTLPGGFSRSQRVAFRHAAPMPCTLVSIMPKITTEAN